MGPPKRPRVSREGMSGQGSNKTLFTEASRVWPAAVPLCQPGPQGCGARAPRLGDADLELSQGKQLAKAWGPDRICEIALAGRVGAWGGWERSPALLECCQPISTPSGVSEGRVTRAVPEMFYCSSQHICFQFSKQERNYPSQHKCLE